MLTKKPIGLFVGIFLLTSITISAQTVRMNAAKANDYGVAYTLPKTSFKITYTVKKNDI